MKKFKLRGIAEGVMGKSSIEALSFGDLVKTYPELDSVKEKLTVKAGQIEGFAACDG